MLLLQPRENLDFQEYKFITLFFYFSRAGILLSLQLYVIFHTFKTLHKLLEKNFFFQQWKQICFHVFLFLVINMGSTN